MVDSIVLVGNLPWRFVMVVRFGRRGLQGFGGWTISFATGSVAHGAECPKQFRAVGRRQTRDRDPFDRGLGGRRFLRFLRSETCTEGDEGRSRGCGEIQVSPHDELLVDGADIDCERCPRPLQRTFLRRLLEIGGE